MGLSDSQFQEIMRKYDKTRLENGKILSDRRAYVYSNVADYEDLDKRVVKISMDAARKKLAGDENALVSLHEEISKLSFKKNELLKKAGLPEDYLNPIYNCIDCKDTGYIENKKCHCLTKQISDILYEQSNIADLLEENNFSKLSREFYSGEDLERFIKAEKNSHDFTDNFPNCSNLLFMGTVGTGKSFLSGCIAKELLDKGYSVLYFSAAGLFDTLAKDTFAPDNKDDLYILYDYLYNCDLLIIDDLGTEFTNDFIKPLLFKILNERDLRKKPVIISTNLSLENIRSRYTDRIFSRIVRSFTSSTLTGEDIRIQKKKLNTRKRG